MMSKRFILTNAIWLMLLFLSTVSYSQVPRTISYQGKITNTSGTPLDGTYSITFSLYDVTTGGTTLWSETKSVTVTKGLFTTALGDTTPIGLTFNKQYFVGVKVGSDAELIPRQSLQSVPYALAMPGVTIDSNNNVGIGNPLPARKLSVSGGITVDQVGECKGELDYGIVFGGDHSGEGLASRRTPDGADYTGITLYTAYQPRIAIVHSGYVGIGTINPSALLDVNGEANINGTLTVKGTDFRITGRGGGNGNNGGIGRALVDAGPGGGLVINYANDFGNVIVQSGLSCNSLTLTSSQRFKTNVKPITKPIETLSQLQGISYQWDKMHGGKQDIGFIAEDVAKILPEIVTMESDGKNARGMDYSHLVALTVEAIKAQQREIEALKAQVREVPILKAKIRKLENASARKKSKTHQ